MYFSSKLQHWYLLNKRDLPWPNTLDPYQIWLSEVILQQTRVDQGLPYFLKFCEHFPTVQDLASAPEDQVLKLWQGLGYYSRARNLQVAARQIVSDHNGVFPKEYSKIRALKGVGDYTAAAIASICFNLPYAVLDGNVFRVLSRFYGVETCILSNKGKKEFSSLAMELLDSSNPGNHNQAVMELGARVCTPQNPKCNECPVAEGCFARKNVLQGNFPVKSKGVSVRPRFFNYLFLNSPQGFLIRKRTAKDIWQGLYEFPLSEVDRLLDPVDSELLYELNIFQPVAPVFSGFEDFKHKLSHQTIYARFFIFDVMKLNIHNDFELIAPEGVESRGFPQLLINFLKRINEAAKH